MRFPEWETDFFLLLLLSKEQTLRPIEAAKARAGQLYSFTCIETRVQNHKVTKIEVWSCSSCKASDNLFFKQMAQCDLEQEAVTVICIY